MDNSMHGIDFLYRYATSAMDDELLDGSFVAVEQQRCACCGRASGAWPRPEAVVSLHYGVESIHCLPCRALFHGSAKYLGVERAVKTTGGTVDAPGKLGMLATCAMLVTRSEAIIFTGDGYREKLARARAPFYRLERRTGFQQVLALLELNPEPPFLFIADLGRKKPELVEHLRVTVSGDRWHLCSANGIATVDPRLIAKLLKIIRTSGMDIDIVAQWLQALRRASAGYIPANDRTIVQLTDRLPEFRKTILPLLPNDPYQRIDTARIVQSLMESGA